MMKKSNNTGIKGLLTNLMGSLDEFKLDAVLMDAIGRDSTDLFIENRTQKWHYYIGESLIRIPIFLLLPTQLNVLFHMMEKTGDDVP